MNTNQDLVEVFDTTLRDGLQVEGVSATVDDKLRIAEQLDHLGVHFIEGGWPGANPKDVEFFQRALAELHLTTSTMVAFGSTRRPRGKVDDDTTLRNLLDAQTAAVCIVFHVRLSAIFLPASILWWISRGNCLLRASWSSRQGFPGSP